MRRLFFFSPNPKKPSVFNCKSAPAAGDRAVAKRGRRGSGWAPAGVGFGAGSSTGKGRLPLQSTRRLRSSHPRFAHPSTLTCRLRAFGMQGPTDLGLALAAVGCHLPRLGAVSPRLCPVRSLRCGDHGLGACCWISLTWLKQGVLFKVYLTPSFALKNLLRAASNTGCFLWSSCPFFARWWFARQYLGWNFTEEKPCYGI